MPPPQHPLLVFPLSSTVVSSGKSDRKESNVHAFSSLAVRSLPLLPPTLKLPMLAIAGPLCEPSRDPEGHYLFPRTSHSPLSMSSRSLPFIPPEFLCCMLPREVSQCSGQADLLPVFSWYLSASNPTLKSDF